MVEVGEFIGKSIAIIFTALYVLAAIGWLWFRFSDLSEADERLMDKWNLLHKCKDCGKYSRNYNIQQHRLEKIVYGGLRETNANTCPHCESASIPQTGDSFGFLKSLPECMELDKKDFRKQQKTMDRLKEAVKEAEEINAFIEYHKLTRPPEQVKDSEFYYTKRDGEPTLIEIKFPDRTLSEKYLKEKDNWTRIENILNEEQNHAKRIQKMRTRTKGNVL